MDGTWRLSANRNMTFEPVSPLQSQRLQGFRSGLMEGHAADPVGELCASENLFREQPRTSSPERCSFRSHGLGFDWAEGRVADPVGAAWSMEELPPEPPWTSSPKHNSFRLDGLGSDLMEGRVADPVGAAWAMEDLLQEQPRTSSPKRECRLEGFGSDLQEGFVADPFGAVRSSNDLIQEQPHAALPKSCSSTLLEPRMSALPVASLPHEEFAEELTCSICLELFQKPVILPCGHSFCQSCIDAVCMGKLICPCPVCRKAFLQGMYIKIMSLDILAEKVREGSKERIDPREQCKDHQETLKLFCTDDWSLACLICRDAPKHDGHRFLPIQDAVNMFKGQLRDCLVRLNATKRKSLDQMKNHKRLIQEQEWWELLHSTTRDYIASVFNKFYFGLLTQEEVMFVELEAAQQKTEDHLLQLNKDCQKVQETLQRAQSHLDEADPLEFFEGIQSCLEQCSEEHTLRDPVAEVSCFLSQILSNGPTEHVIWKRLKSSLRPARARLTLDPASAHCDLVLSEDRTSVWYTQPQRPPHHNDRFGACTVLASEGFTSGEHYWEVHVGSGNWVVGVAEECVTSDQDVHLFPWSGAMVLEMSEFEASQRSGTAETARFIPTVPRPQKLGVYLDFDCGLVSCYNAEDMSLIRSSRFLTRSKIVPYFRFCADGTKGNSETLSLLV